MVLLSFNTANAVSSLSGVPSILFTFLFNRSGHLFSHQENLRCFLNDGRHSRRDPVLNRYIFLTIIPLSVNGLLIECKCLLIGKAFMNNLSDRRTHFDWVIGLEEPNVALRTILFLPINVVSLLPVLFT